jgi:hypothetical protein
MSSLDPVAMFFVLGFLAGAAAFGASAAAGDL